MKKFKKFTCIALCLSLIAGASTVALGASSGDVDYKISNPYANVDFDAVHQYKTALHTHTNASDGEHTLKQSLERHALQGFDIVAITDHGICNTSWADVNYSKFVHGALRIMGRNEGDVEYMGTEGTLPESGIAYTDYIDPDTGDEYLQLENGANMMRIPYGIENNALSINAHVNSWFVPYADNTPNGYEVALKGVQKAGGICVINHPGEYTKAKKDLTSDEAYNYSNPAYRYYINLYYGLIKKYSACMGIDINSKGDSRTRYDRKLWDILLSRASAEGWNIYAIASSDAHHLDIINSGYTRLLMPEKTSAAARSAMENGEFFPCSYYNGNHEELLLINEAIKEFYGEIPMYYTIKRVTDEMAQRVEEMANGEVATDEDLGVELQLVDGDGYFHGQDTYITNIKTDDAEDTITVETDNALIVRWISNGKQIAVSNAANGVCTLDLDDFDGELGGYIRAEAFGEGGTVYTEAFLLDYEGAPAAHCYPYININIVDALFAELRFLDVRIRRAIHNLFN